MNLIVKPFERLRYLVSSRTSTELYLVDIGSFSINGVSTGKCCCHHFTMTLFPMLRAGWQANKETGLFRPNDAYRCAHIIAARKFAFDEILAKLISSVVDHYADYDGDEEREQLEGLSLPGVSLSPPPETSLPSVPGHKCPSEDNPSSGSEECPA